MYRLLSRHLILFLSCFLLGCSAGKQLSKTTKQDSQKAVQRIRALYFERDFALGQSEGKQAIRQFPESAELQAWFLGNMARNGRADDAMKEAQKMVGDNPENPWSYFSLALVSDVEPGGKSSNIQAAKQALSMKPNHPDFLWIRAKLIPDEKQAIAFTDSIMEKVENPANLLVIKGTKLAGLAQNTSGNQQEQLFKQAFAVFNKARQVDPGCFNAWYLPAKYYNQKGANQKALKMYQKAVAKTSALTSHAEYWQMVLGMNQMKMKKRRRLVTTDMQSLASQRPLTAEVMFSLAHHYQKLDMPEKRQEYEEKILQQYPGSIFAEEVLSARFRNYRRKHSKQIHKNPDPQIIDRYQELLWNFIEHPHHSNKRALASAYRKLFRLYREYQLMNEEELEKVAEGLLQYDGFSTGISSAEVALFVTEQTENLPLAQQVAELSVRRISASNAGLGNFEKSAGYDALGWVYLQKDRIDSAQKYLEKAYELTKKDREIIYHMGKLYEKMDHYELAEKFYRKGYRIEGPGKNPNTEALRSLYAETHGGREGYAGYQSKLQTRIDNQKKIHILNSWIGDPQTIKPFQLQELGGKTFSSKRLEGKVAVINFWGTWCGSCLKEMPDIQKLYDKYRHNPEIKIITINNDYKARTVKNWIADHDYDFPVLRGNDYVHDVNIHEFPTTWFLNEEGEVAFVKAGLTDSLVKHFSWRIEALAK